MEGKELYGYTKHEWFLIIVCYMVFLFFGGIEASEGVYYGLMKEELGIPYKIQGYLVSMSSWSFIIGSPIVGYLMTVVDVKPIIVIAFIAYFIGYVALYHIRTIWPVFIALFIEGLGGVLLDVGMNTLSTVIFKKHRGVMMNYLHFFYGLGSSFGPHYSNYFLKTVDIGYRGVFVGLYIPCIIGFISTLCSKFSLNQENKSKELPVKEHSSEEKEKSSEEITEKQVENSESQKEVQVEVSSEIPDDRSLWSNFLSPLVWLLGLNMGAVYAIESITVNWSGLYLKEMFGVTTDDVASFLSYYYIFYTVARLVTGFIIDFIGDTNSVILFNCILIVFYVVCFIVGRPAMWILSFSGFLMSPFYPTAITVPMEVLGKHAGKAISVILCIALIVNWVIQVFIGYINEFVGYQWGYRVLSIAMCIMMIICMLSIQCMTRRKNNA